MRHFGWFLWIVGCLFAAAYVPWKWTWANIAGSIQNPAGYSWLWSPLPPPLELGIGWQTQIDLERWGIQAFIILILIGASIPVFYHKGQKNKEGL